MVSFILWMHSIWKYIVMAPFRKQADCTHTLEYLCFNTMMHIQMLGQALQNVFERNRLFHPQVCANNDHRQLTFRATIHFCRPFPKIKVHFRKQHTQFYSRVTWHPNGSLDSQRKLLLQFTNVQDCELWFGATTDAGYRQDLGELIER